VFPGVFLDSWFFGAAFYLPADFFQIRQGSFPGGVPAAEFRSLPFPISAIPEGSVLVSLDQETLREALQFANIRAMNIPDSGDEPLGRGNYGTAIEAGKSLDEMFEQDRNFLQAVAQRRNPKNEGTQR